MSTEALTVGLAVALAVMALEGAFLYLLLRQHGVMLLRHDALSDRLSSLERAIGGLRHSMTAQPQPAPEPLAAGETAPDFALPGLDGRERRLRDFLGEPLVVLFFNPQCSYCAHMAPALGRLSKSASSLLLVSRGEATENERLAAENAWRCHVVLEPGWEVATAYRTRATPTGYLVDAEGRIASPLTIGADALLKLIETAGSNGNGTGLASHQEKEREVVERARAAGMRVRSVSGSRVNRNGLPAGTAAPGFDLPDLSGEVRSLSELRGRRVLLVFSDPKCGPCQELVPSLNRLHERFGSDGPQILMVSKGEPELNQRKAREQGVEFPVLLQRGAEIAKSYGIFATPVGYLIDEGGTLATDVAIGADAILQLAA